MKYILLFFVGVVLCVPVSVLAVEACAKLDSNTVCTTIADDYNLSDARVDCNGTFVRLIGMCVQNTGTRDVSVRDYLTISATVANNYRCWCMLAEPVTSKWVLRAEYDDVSKCRRQCNIGCKNAFIYNNSVDQTFRKTVMSNLIR